MQKKMDSNNKLLKIFIDALRKLVFAIFVMTQMKIKIYIYLDLIQRLKSNTI